MKKIKAFVIAVCLASAFALSSCSGSFWQGMAAGLGNISRQSMYSGGSSGVSSPTYTGGSYGTMNVPTPTFTTDWSSAPATVPAYGGVSTGTSSSGSTYGGSSGSSSSGKSCPLCYGLGKCRTCNGKQYYLNSLTGKNVACPNCTNGLCSKCSGTGRI